MNKEELDNIEKLDIDLQDIDDLDMGLEIISYKVRTIIQEFANTIMKQQSQLDIANEKLEQMNDAVERATELQQQLQAYKAKEDKLREYCNDKSQYWGNDSYINGKNEENEEVKNDILQILNEGGK